MPYRYIIILLFCSFYGIISCAQTSNTYHYTQPSGDTSKNIFSLTDCINYALKNQPAVNVSKIEENVARDENRIALSGWLPQVYGSANFQKFFTLPTGFSNFNGTVESGLEGTNYVSIPQITASQTLFSSDVLLAAKGAKLNTQRAQENTAATKIELVADVTKAFYNLLLSKEQIGVFQDDTARLRKNYQDAYDRYVSGIADKVDYKQASIALNNSLSNLKTATEAVNARYATLKQLMGFTGNNNFSLLYDTTTMMQEIIIDTNAVLNFEKRIEYQQLITAKRIQKETTNYYRMSILPSLSAFYNYDYEFQNNSFSKLYDNAYPYSLFGLQLNLPIFSGLKRTSNLHKAKLEQDILDWDEVDLKLGIQSQYIQALANYKSNFYYLFSQRDNRNMAREVYEIVRLQYREGVKAYLDVINAETDLKTSEINYLNALFQLLSSKIDLQKALGDITVDK